MITTVHRALVISFIERYALIVLSLLSNILIARLVTPEEIGLYSVSLAVIGVAQVLRDFGVGSYLIQEKNLTEDHIRTAFGVSLLIGGSLFLIVFLASSLGAEIYGEPRMATTLRICALNFVILPFCTVSLALLRREMLFQKVLYVTLSATLIGFVVSISLAVVGFGANSMAVGTVATNLATGFFAWLARGGKVIMAPSLSQWRSVSSFGAQRSVASIAGSVSTDINELVAGKILGFTPLAMLSRAQGLMNLFQRDLMTAVNGVALPAFAQASREKRDVETQHTVAIAAITVVGWPFFGFVALFPLELLRLLFGSQWDQAAPLVPLYCAAGAAAAPSYLITTMLTAVGRIDIATKIDLVVQPLRAGFFVSGLMLVPQLETPPLLFFIAAVCATPYCFHMKNKAIPTNTGYLFKSLGQSAMVTSVTLLGPMAITAIVGRADGLVSAATFIISLACAAAAWFAGLYVFRHPMTQDPLFISLVGRITHIWRRHA